ncbi:DUF2946 family protein [Microbulbifer litoralis]|uniref:DUF2946 family protein n=1 Tax=Microbulbifer litoralis TaxID=2933965 RepID=UPI002029385A|nr:DUF2946 family protein [Microbulbifer sp. GX H0434]
MPQTGTPIQRPTARLPRSLALLLLCVFLCARGLVPAGFMPAPLSGGAPYGFCHGDGNSALLLQWLQREYHHHHGGHHHDGLTAHAFADNHCNFSAAAGLAAAPSVDLQVFIAGISTPAAAPTAGAARSRTYTQPPSRAPPRFPSA